MKIIPFTIPVKQNQSIVLQEDRLPHFYPHLHRHPDIQITVIWKGEGTLLAGSYLQHFKQGEVYLIGANQPHVFKSDASYFDRRRKKSVHALTIFFNPGGSLSNLFNLPEMKGIQRWIGQSGCGFAIPANRQDEVASSMLQIQKTSGPMQLTHFIGLLQLLSSIRQLKQLSAVNSSTLFSDSDGQRLNAIYRFSMEHYQEPISLHRVASIAHMTVPAFCRYFKKRTRKTYIRFLNELRISEACRLLLQDEQGTVSNIAWNTGFINVSSFNRTFKQETGHSPREFRSLKL